MSKMFTACGDQRGHSDTAALLSYWQGQVTNCHWIHWEGVFLGFTRIETRVVSCIIAFSSCCLDFMVHVPQPFACYFFLHFPIFQLASSCRQISSFNKWNFMCRKVKIGHRKIINLSLEKWHALKKWICHIQEHQSFNLLHDAQMSWMWQSGASLGKLHLESGFWDQETESKSGENQTQAWFQEQSWLDGKTERKLGRKRKRGKLTPSKMLERLSWKSVSKTAVQDGLSFGRVCRRT